MKILKWHGLDVDPMKISESITTKVDIGQIDTAFNESTSESGITVLYPKIEAIHAGRTRNYNRYTAEKLKGDPELRSGVYSWTAPYPKPVIYNHDPNTEATGRVYSASYSEFTRAGRPGIIVTPKITDPKAIQGVLDERLFTVSIGATTNAAVCSVCGTDIINEGWCGHMRGEEHDGQIVEWIAGDLFFDELSWVNIPADSDAVVISNGASNQLIATSESKPDTNNYNYSILTGTILSSKIGNTSALTPEEVVVKSVSESTTKEENIVKEKDNVQETVVEETNTKVEAQEEPTTQEEHAVQETATETHVEESAETQVEESLQVKVTELEEALQAEKDKLAEAQRSVEELTAANELLAKDLHETIVNFLVDLRMSMGKEDNRESALSKFGARSIESLRDSIADALTEKTASTATMRTVERVEKPQGIKKEVTESKTVTTEAAKVTSNEDALLHLLGARR